jgi:tetratricopeptide (TPR) repeat protein
MPRRDNSSIAHMVSTDHRIRRRPGLEQAPTHPMDHRPADGINLVLFQQGTQGRTDADLGRDRGVALMDLAGLPQPEGARRRLAEAARRWLEPAARETPDDVPAQQALGYALWLLGRQDDGWAAFQAALAREPEREETLVYAAGLRAQMQYPDEALELWQRVRRINPWSARAAVEMARLHIERRDWPQARAACETALRLDPFRDAARQLAIVCAWRSGQQDKARAEFEKLLRIRPQNEKALRAWFEREQGAVH